MPQGMSDDVRDVIVQALARGLSRGQISGVVGVSKRAITRINTNLKKHGTAKAPPTGVKMGRPAKMNDTQAQAMLGWMAERDYTFYIKDLVKYLREEHGFAGCDGTVRRVLVRAGFKRKLPWHKSEITTWLPPQPTTDAEHLQIQQEHPDGSPSQVQAQVEAQPQGLPTGDIDPALEQHHAQLPHQPPTANMQQHSPHAHASSLQQYQPSSLLQQHHPSPPMYQPAQHHPLPHTQQPNTSFDALPMDPSPSGNSATTSSLTAAAGGGLSAAAAHLHNGNGPPAPTALPPKNRRQSRNKASQLETRLNSLEDDLAQKNELIAKLQQQLAAQATAAQASSSPPPQHGNPLQQDVNDGLNGQQHQQTPYHLHLDAQAANGYA